MLGITISASQCYLRFSANKRKLMTGGVLNYLGSLHWVAINSISCSIWSQQKEIWARIPGFPTLKCANRCTFRQFGNLSLQATNRWALSHLHPTCMAIAPVPHPTPHPPCWCLCMSPEPNPFTPPIPPTISHLIIPADGLYVTCNYPFHVPHRPILLRLSPHPA